MYQVIAHIDGDEQIESEPYDYSERELAEITELLQKSAGGIKGYLSLDNSGSRSIIPSRSIRYVQIKEIS